MDNYTPNSKKSKKETIEKVKVEKVVKGVVKKKKSGFLNSFLSDDIADIKDYIIQDVLIPAAKKAIDDIVSNGISMLLYGETGRGRKSSLASRVSYRSYYDDRDRSDPKDREKNVSRTRVREYDDIILETRAEAEEVISRLDELIEVYGIASVADLYELVGISGQHTDNKYGWTSVRDATHVRVRDGYLLKLPRVRPID